jgi:hypothetical protein
MTRDLSDVNPVEMALRLGCSLAQAIRVVLGKSISELARDEGWNRAELSSLLHGQPGRRCAEWRDRLSERLGVERADLDEWIAREAENRRLRGGTG